MNRLDRIKGQFYFAKHGESHGQTDIEFVIKKLDTVTTAIEVFVEDNFQGGSKSDRDDYHVLVSCSDIYKLREAMLSIREETK